MATATATRSNVSLLRQLYAAFAEGDVPSVISAMDPNIEWVSAEGAPYPGTFIGPQAILANVFARLGGEWDNYQVQPTEFIDAGDTVVALGRYSGTYKATGRSMDAAFAHVWTLRDGRVVRFRQHTDTRKMAEAL